MIPDRSTSKASGPGLRPCSKVCQDIRSEINAKRKSVLSEYDLWKGRLGVKADTVTYLRGNSAAEGLLGFMSSYYVTRAPEKQMDPSFLAYFMLKCFPEAYVDVDNVKLSGLVDTVWAAKNMKIEKQINSCM